ncbi:hypothetical protein E2C01_007512 [Portunus trituberculatus]|uniref:Uncharacterized protein n=1 Tax=Portunus trituberculatus TaxID=210409 RepID=A0A5B7D0P1_PORTR|nr:hypothetical protein [Portunus trituberculatus]
MDKVAQETSAVVGRMDLMREEIPAAVGEARQITLEHSKRLRQDLSEEFKEELVAGRILNRTPSVMPDDRDLNSFTTRSLELDNIYSHDHGIGQDQGDGKGSAHGKCERCEKQTAVGNAMEDMNEGG